MRHQSARTRHWNLSEPEELVSHEPKLKMSLEHNRSSSRRHVPSRRTQIRQSSTHYPERLREGADVQDDVTAVDGKPAQHMNQSVFSMIAAAGSKADFNARFDEESSDSDVDQELSESIAPLGASQHASSAHDEANETGSAPTKAARHGRVSENKRLRAFPKLKLKTVEERNYMSQSTILPSPKDPEDHMANLKKLTPRDAPVMGKMLEAQAKISLAVPSAELESEYPTGSPSGEPPNILVLRLKEIFAFEEAEEVISGTFLIQSSNESFNFFLPLPIISYLITGTSILT